MLAPLFVQGAPGAGATCHPHNDEPDVVSFVVRPFVSDADADAAAGRTLTDDEDDDEPAAAADGALEGAATLAGL